MTIEKARQILGKHAIGKTDEEIGSILMQESKTCDALLMVFEGYLTSYKRSLNNRVTTC